jgi:hypothetical protein
MRLSAVLQTRASVKAGDCRPDDRCWGAAVAMHNPLLFSG